MSYPDIPRFATSWNCSRAQYRKVWKFENAAKRKAQRVAWAKANPAYELIKHPVSYDASGLGIGLESILMSEQKSPLELLMEKEEAEACAC